MEPKTALESGFKTVRAVSVSGLTGLVWTEDRFV